MSIHQSTPLAMNWNNPLWKFKRNMPQESLNQLETNKSIDIIDAVKSEKPHVFLWERERGLTCNHACPPQWFIQVRIAANSCSKCTIFLTSPTTLFI